MWFDTVDFPKDGDGCRWDSTPHDPVTRVRLQGVGHVRVHQHRPVKGRVKTVSVKREGRQWYVILACDEVPGEPLPTTGAACGIDMGIAHFLTTSEGEHIANPRHGKRSAHSKRFPGGSDDVIAHERLSIANMVRVPMPKPDPEQPGSFLPNGAAAKAGLNKSIHDAGWGGVPGHPRAQG